MRVPPALAFNSGSSFLEGALYRCTGTGEDLVERGSVSAIASGCSQVNVENGDGSVLWGRSVRIAGHREAFKALCQAYDRLGLPAAAVIGHRVVHGGPDRADPGMVTEALLENLDHLVPLAPLHRPGATEGLKIAQDYFPHVPQVACFDTAFYRRMPEVARRLPLPDDPLGFKRFSATGFFVFTGGIGERSAPIRAFICESLTYMGIENDRERRREAWRK